MKKLIAGTVALAAGMALAAVPITVNYVGRLTGMTNGGDEKALTEKVMLMVFRLYDKPGLGRMSDKAAPLWGRRASVAMSDGEFDVDLSDTLGMPVGDARYTSLADAICAVLATGSSDLYVGLTPENDANAEIFPRQRLTAVPYAVQAAAVRSVESDFTSTGGVFTVRGRLEVNGPTTFGENVSYGDLAFGAKSSVDVRAGVLVEGPIVAKRVEAADVAAASAEVGQLVTQDSGKLSVSNRFACAGTVTWKDSPSWSQTTVEAPAVAGTVSATSVAATKIVAESFDNPKGFSSQWSVLGSWENVSSLPAQVYEQQAFAVCNTKTGAKDFRNSVVGGLWQAPCDCLAYFQVTLLNLSATDSVWLQFYLVPSATTADFSSRNPVGVAALGPGANTTLQTAVPVLLRKGELVKWLGYNNNANPSSGQAEITHTTVTAIRYLTFNW